MTVPRSKPEVLNQGAVHLRIVSIPGAWLQANREARKCLVLFSPVLSCTSTVRICTLYYTWVEPTSLSSTYRQFWVAFGVSYTKKVHVRTGQTCGFDLRTVDLHLSWPAMLATLARLQLSLRYTTDHLFLMTPILHQKRRCYMRIHHPPPLPPA